MSCSPSRAARRLRKKLARKEEAHNLRVLARDGEDAYVDRVLAQQADRWAKAQWGEHARGAMAKCRTCGAEFMTVITITGPAADICRGCSAQPQSL